MKKRIISILLLCCMVLTMLPAPAFAADEETYALPPDTDSLCEHHPEHDEACGYTPQTEDAAGTPCGHVCEICESGDGGADPAGPAGTSGAAMSRTLLGAARPAATQYTYTLHYDANGGSGAPPSQSVKSTEFYVWVPISEKIPTRDGYTFMGWANTRTGKPIYGGNGGYTECLVVHGSDMSTTIYAIWEVHNHSWGEWTSNGNGTHTRTCTTDSSHTETGSCSGGKATGTEKAICETCHTAYGELLPLTKTVITTPPTLPSEGYVGDQYLDEALEGGEAKVEGTDVVVPGSFRFKHNWGGVVGPGENRMEVLFIPDDTETYATAECIVTVTGLKHTITSVTEEVLPDEPLGTAFEDLWFLPPFVEVKTNTGRTFFPIPVTWDSSSYDPNKYGEQIITGELHVEKSSFTEELEPTSIKAIARITLIGDGAIVPTLEPPTYSRQIYSGDFCQLAFSDEYLSGGTATADGETVDGVFTLNEEQEKYGYWHRGGGLVQVGLLALKVTFNPYDRLRFSTAECTVNVDVIPRKFRQANTSYIDNKKIGTAFEDLGLPNAFYFFAEADEPNHEGSGLNGSVPGIIKWDDSNYDPNSYEEQTIYGEVNRAEFEKYYIVPEGADLRGVVKITLQADPVETEITQPPVFQWKNGYFTLPNNTMFVNRIFEMGATGGGSANLADGVAKVKGTDTVVPGTFSFKEGTPGWFDELGENVVTVVFTPTDQHGYRTAETTIKVNVIKNTFKRCEEPDPITEKKLGTTFAGLNLPEIVVVEAIDGLRVGMEVSWDESSYDAQSTAWQTIPGTLVFDANDEHRYQQPEPAVTAAIRVKLLGSEDAPAITTTTLPGGTVGTPYHHQLQATGGGFILWELFSGELPDGLTLKQTTGEISGTPTAEQTAQFTVRALNSVGNDKKELSITITNAPAAEHTVTVTNDGNGIGAATPSTATAGTTITLTATPDEGYHFKEWQVMRGNVTIKDDKFTMPDSEVEIKAIFEKDTPPVPTLEPPAYSKQLYGGDLCNFVFSSLYLSGGKATVNGIEVPGMFTLDQNQEIYGHLLTDSEYLQAGPLGLKVIFTPNDQTKYAAAECTVNVNVIPRKYMYSNARYIDNRKIGTPFAELNISNSFYFFAVGDENKPEETGMDYGMPVITKWDESSYDPNSYEEQTIYGEVNRAKLEKYFTIPEGADLRGVIKVTLQADPAETEITQLPVLRWKKGEFALPDNTIFVRRQFRAETNGNETTGLVGGVVKVKGTDTVVPGTFSIKQETPDIFSSVGEYDVNVVFTPDDSRAHIPVETSIKINVVKNTLKETVEEAPITNKALGTPFEELGLPESVWAVAVDGYIVYSLDVAWDASSYDAQSPDWQTLTGTLVLSTYEESLYQQPDPAVTAAIRVKLIGPAVAPTIITDALPDGTVGTPYSQRLFANGTEPITWRVVAGELPKGLDLNETTGEISGTPTAAGTASFTVKATNSAGSDTKELSITITKAPAAEYTVTVTTEGGGTASASPAKAAAGTEITLTATPNTGYHFKEWQVESPAGLVITNNKFTMPDSNVAIKAIFEEDSPFAPTKHTVTVKTDGNGIAFASPLLAVAGTEITLTAMPKKGYHFKEWQVINGGVTIKDDKFLMPNDNVEVKAIFEKDAPPAPPEFIVTFDGNGGTPSVGSMTTTNQKLTSLPSASRSGSYSFDGWYTEKSGGTKVTTDTKFHANTTVHAHWTYIGGGYNPPVTYYTLRFETGGGSDIPSVREAYNAYIDLTQYVPTWRGHTFIGWYSERGLTNKVSGVYLTKDMTVYAGWRVDENPGTGANPFTDVSEKDWFYGDVMFVYENGLMLGTSKTLFSPHGTATRGMMATILWRMEGSPAPKGKNSFTDVEAGKWYADAITWTAENGIFAGYGKDKFGPDDPITREQLAAIFYRYADYKGYDLTVKGNLDKFKDADKITDYAKAAMLWAVGSGLVKGKSGNLLDPQGTATRAEIAAMLHRFIEKYELMQGKAPGGLMG